jgi:hypothetical protein
MFLFRSLQFLVVSSFLFSSCAYKGPYREDAAHPIRTITIARNVTMPEHMVFRGLSETLTYTAGAAAGGGAGAGLATSSFRGKRVNDFGLPESLRSEFRAAIQKSGRFVVKDQGPADAELRLHVGGYGFESKHPWQREVHPVLGMHGELVRSDGKIAWTFYQGVIHLTGGTPAVLPEQIKENPQVGVDALRAAARMCAEKTAKDL